MKQWRDRSLQSQLLIGISLWMAALLVLGGGVILGARAFLLSVLVDKGETLGRTTAGTARFGVATENALHDLDRLVEAVAAEADVRHVAILSADGNVLAASQQNRELAKACQQARSGCSDAHEPCVANLGGDYLFCHKVDAPAEELGARAATTDRNGIVLLLLSPSRVNRMIWLVSLIVFFITALISVCGGFFAIRFTNPISLCIRRLLHAYAKLGSGSDYAVLPIDSENELGSLTRGFNIMVAGLRTAQETLQRQREYVEAILQCAADAILVIDSNGTVGSLNDEAARLLGQPAIEVVGRAYAALACNDYNKGAYQSMSVGASVFAASTADADEKTCLGAFIERIVKFGVAYDVKLCLFSMDAMEIPVIANGAVLQDRDGSTLGVVITMRDMRQTYRLLAEAATATAAREKAEELALACERAESATRELRSTQDQLLQAEKMSAVGQLAGGVAHEINNPLGVILGFAQGMERRVPEGDALRLPVTSIVREALRCKNLVQELLTFSRTGKKVAEEIDLAALVRSTVVLLEARAKTQGVEVVQELHEDVPIVRANRTQLQQVIVNLGTNAMDAMQSGGTLTLRTRLNGGGTAIIDVADTGHGIPEEIRTRIFEPFFTTKEVGKGTGLGLSLVWEIIRQHDGKIEVSSHPGKGTVMSVQLPAIAEYASQVLTTQEQGGDPP